MKSRTSLRQLGVVKMETIEDGEGRVYGYRLGPLRWEGTASIIAINNTGYKIAIQEDPTWEEPKSVFEYFTDEQMQELFLAYIALKEARERENAD